MPQVNRYPYVWILSLPVLTWCRKGPPPGSWSWSGSSSSDKKSPSGSPLKRFPGHKTLYIINVIKNVGQEQACKGPWSQSLRPCLKINPIVLVAIFIVTFILMGFDIISSFIILFVIVLIILNLGKLRMRKNFLASFSCYLYWAYKVPVHRRTRLDDGPESGMDG